MTSYYFFFDGGGWLVKHGFYIKGEVWWEKIPHLFENFYKKERDIDYGLTKIFFFFQTREPNMIWDHSCVAFVSGNCRSVSQVKGCFKSKILVHIYNGN